MSQQKNRLELREKSVNFKPKDVYIYKFLTNYFLIFKKRG